MRDHRIPLHAAALFATCLFAGRASADDPALDEAARRERIAYLKATIAEFEVTVGEDRARVLKHSEEPLLRYSNPVRVSLSDGGVFLWTENDRPRAIAMLSIRGLEAPRVFREFTSLSAEPLVCSRNRRPMWSPRSGGLVDRPLVDAPAPGATAAARLSQMRTLAGRFHATIYKPIPDTDDEDPATELRLLTRQLHRYGKEGSAILDGAVFAFAEGTDPEAVLLLEAVRQREGSGHEWRYTLGRMTSVHLTMQLDGTDVWSVPNFWRNPRTPDDPYVEAFVENYVPPPGATSR